MDQMNDEFESGKAKIVVYTCYINQSMTGNFGFVSSDKSNKTNKTR